MKKRTVILIGVAAAALWGGWASAPFWFPNWNATSAGTWGDAFGGLNAAFSAAAFIAVLRTIRMQSEEIAGQQKEIDRQNERLEKADRDARLQQFESTFFQLFELFRELRVQAKWGKDGVRGGLGREAFEAAEKELLFYLFPRYAPAETVVDAKAVVEGVYGDGIQAYSYGSFGPYFRVLYTLLRRVSESKFLSEDEKIRYGNLIRSQLSSSEIALAAANALGGEANNFSDFIVEFRLLKFLPLGEYRTLLERIYPKETFEERDRVERVHKLRDETA